MISCSAGNLYCLLYAPYCIVSGERCMGLEIIPVNWQIVAAKYIKVQSDFFEMPMGANYDTVRLHGTLSTCCILDTTNSACTPITYDLRDALQII